MGMLPAGSNSFNFLFNFHISQWPLFMEAVNRVAYEISSDTIGRKIKELYPVLVQMLIQIKKNLLSK